jgi:UDP-N-acetylmuramoyl-L-alanyl-D-glutamate--2,6-diaminopimelate ligase
MLAVKQAHHFVNSLLRKAIPAAVYFGFPGKKLKIYSITGTDGKTTSSTMLFHALKTAGRRVALISTVAAFIGEEEIDTGFHTTSPEPWQIHKLLARCVKQGVDEVVLEVTSHGVFQYRVWGMDIALAGVTNITNEHLDYFETWELYAKAKSRLLERAQLAVLNADDRSFAYLSNRQQALCKSYLTYSQQLPEGEIGKAIKKRFPESYNQWNASLVWTMAKQLGVSAEKFVKSIETFPGVKGRMQFMPNTLGMNIVVDFAHTPNALESALKALRPQTSGKMIAVFGCAGLRDRTKRPAMGGISTRLADLAVFTAEDPRTEDIQVIFRQMKEGVEPKNLRKVVTMADRGEAIAFAFSQAKKGDTIGIFGKGHELSMCWGTTEYPWSDQEAAKKLISAQGK